jgi:hypothetical protein
MLWMDLAEATQWVPVWVFALVGAIFGVVVGVWLL